jgi:hypothetical protein
LAKADKIVEGLLRKAADGKRRLADVATTEERYDRF